MGVFNFIKSAGQKYVDVQKRNFELLKDVVGLGDDDKDEKKAPAKPAATKTASKTASVKPPAPTAEQKAAIIMAEAKSLGLGGDYRVMVEGESVKLKGKVPDRATLEKIILASGNMEGISQVDATELASDAGCDASVFYTVKKGDTLSKIAKVYLGNAMKYPDIFEANTPMLSHPDKIYPGQVLRIPGGKAPAEKV
jgi:nucleoid-associated protein YgaU